MSAEPALDVAVDLEGNRAEGALTIAIDKLFIDGELRLWEYPDGWEGYVVEKGTYYRIDTRFDPETLQGKMHVGEQAVRDAIVEHIADRDAGGVGRFERGCSA